MRGHLANPSRQAVVLEQLESYRRQQERLQLLLDVIRNITRELILDRLLLRIMDEVKQVLDCERCSVFIVDEERGELATQVAHGASEIRFAKNLGLAGYVATTGEVLNIPDAYQDPRFNPEIDRQTGFVTRSVLTTPLRNSRGEIIGVFQALNKTGGPFTDEDVELLEAIGVIAASQIENAQLYEEQKKSFDSFIETLAGTIDARDPMTAGHSRRIALYADEIALIVALDEREREILRTAALLHDYGKIAVREAVLTKKTTLTREEFLHIQRHPLFTRSILEKINFTRHLREVPHIASAHHEKLDGSGYPDGLKGEEIPKLSRILAVCDVFDALTSVRHYRDRLPIVEVMRIIEDGAGKEFDPQFVGALKTVTLDRLLRIMENGFFAPAEEDLRLLSRYSLRDLLQAAVESADAEGQLLLNTFDFYYSRRYLREQL
ncbi:MAG: GAF domain-containing protein [candidate division KSB1 bacterium]|nr:GAF domain-containing protein [candidate division KSB1 bacterium]